MARYYRKGSAREAGLKYLGHDLIDTKSRVILRREVTRATGTAEPDTALEMLDEVLENEEELGLPQRPEILTGDTGYGSGTFVAAVLERGLQPHILLLAAEEMEDVPTWQRRTFDLDQMRTRKQKVREAESPERSPVLDEDARGSVGGGRPPGRSMSGRRCAGSGGRMSTSPNGRLGELFLATLLMGGCGDALQDPGRTVRDSAGVRIVEHGVLPHRVAFALGDPLFRLGWSTEGPEFDRVGGGVLLESGRVAVGDAGTHRILVVEESGEIHAVLGGPGEGPGEIGHLTSLHALPGDTIVVEDDGNGRTTLYHGGRVVATHVVEGGSAVTSLMGVGLLDRELILSVSAYPPYFDEPWYRVPIVRHPVGTREWDTIGVYDFRPRISPDRTPPPFRPVGLLGVHPEGVLVARGDRPRVDVMDLRGAPIRRLRWNEAPLEVTDSLWAAYSSYRMARLGSRTEEEMRAHLDELWDVRGDVVPYVSEVRGDAAGRIWASAFSVDYRYPSRYRVFDADGSWLGWVKIPSRTEILDIGESRVLAIERDELDVEAVVVMPLESGSVPSAVRGEGGAR